MKKYILVSTDKFCNLILAVLGVEGENDGFIKENKTIKLCYIIKKDFLGQTLLEVPEEMIISLVKILVSEYFVLQADDIVDVRVKDHDSVIIDIKADVNNGVSLLDDDLRIIAMIGCFLSINVVASKMLRITLSF